MSENDKKPATEPAKQEKEPDKKKLDDGALEDVSGGQLPPRRPPVRLVE